MDSKIKTNPDRYIEKLTHAMIPPRLYEHLFRTALEWAIDGDDTAAQWIIDEVLVMRVESYRREYQSIRTNTDIRSLFIGKPCVVCGAVADTVDHRIPLARGGTNDLDNLQPMCKECNRRKRDTVEQ